MQKVANQTSRLKPTQLSRIINQARAFSKSTPTNNKKSSPDKEQSQENKLKVIPQAKGTEAGLSTKPIQSLNKQYGGGKPLRFDLLSILDRAVNTQVAKNNPNSLVNRAEGAVESLLFTSVTTQVDVEDKGESNIATIDTSRRALGSGLKMHQSSESNRRLSFDKNSLALKALDEGTVDFTDARIQITDAAIDFKESSSGSKSHQLLEVDLGDLRSLRSDQVHIDELLQNSQDRNLQLEKGQQIVDDSTMDGEAQRYKLVMVGRKIRAEEAEEDHYLADIVNDQNQHQITSEVYHESGESFSQAILKNESATKDFFRNLYMPAGLVLAIGAAYQWYSMSHSFGPAYEDHLDYLVFQTVKRGRSLDQLARAMYYADLYSVEGRTS